MAFVLTQPLQRAVVRPSVRCRDDAASAVHYILRAVAADPCAPQFLRSRSIILRRVQATIADIQTSDPTFAQFYALLDDLGGVDAQTAVKMSLFAAATGDNAKVITLAERAVDLEPPTSDRLRHLSQLLAAAGRNEEARRCEHEAEKLAMSFPCAKATA